jgi:Ca2+-binding EF-hand superfamily protein
MDERNKNSKISAKEILDFLKDNFIKHITLEECQGIVTEFDSSLDGSLNYDEFLNIFLPAANANLRQYCLYTNKVASYYTSNKRPLPVSVTSMAVRILEKEKTLVNRRNEIKRDLFKHKDHQKLKTFHSLSRGRLDISMQDLIMYLESNGFHPRTEDLESILRRCDHDADRALSFDEFCEVIEINPELNEADIVEDNGIILDGNKETTLKKDLKESVNTSSLRKRRNSNDRLDGEPKENIEEA